MIELPHNDLTLPQKQTKLLYISELLIKDAEFDADVTAALMKAIKRNPSLSKLVSTQDMTLEEILDINNPIEQPK